MLFILLILIDIDTDTKPCIELPSKLYTRSKFNLFNF